MASDHQVTEGDSSDGADMYRAPVDVAKIIRIPTGCVIEGSGGQYVNVEVEVLLPTMSKPLHEPQMTSEEMLHAATNYVRSMERPRWEHDS